MTRGEQQLIEDARIELASTLAVYGHCHLSDVDMRMDYSGLREGVQNAIQLLHQATRYESLRSTDAEIAAEKAYRPSGVPR